jgi:putative ABC transport system permease protein
MYVPVAQEPDGVTAVDVKLLPLVWIVRTSGDPHLVARGVQQALEKASGGLPVARMRTMDEVLSESTARGRFDTSAVGAFAACALVIAVIGIYGLIAFWIHQRSREIGLRLALGANPVRIVASVIRHGALLAIGGIVIGGAVSLGLAQLMAGLVFGVSPQDPVVFTVVPALLLAVVLAAIAGPAWRASRIDPVASLRAE